MALVYIIKNHGLRYSNTSGLNAVLDHQGNVVCWKTLEHARQFIGTHRMEANFVAVARAIEDLDAELKRLHDRFGWSIAKRIIDGVDFD